MKIEIIFDNGGGATVQTDNFVHCYDDMEQAAQDVRQMLVDDDASGWDGNNPEHRLDPAYEQIRNGGYRVMDADDFEIGAYDDSSWRNVRDFQIAFLATSI